MQCGTFIKWGAQTELDKMIDDEADGEVVTYAERMAVPPDRLAPFMAVPE